MPNTVTVRNEPERGCGYRKAGGLYLVAGGAMSPCGKLPLRLDVCPCCGAGIKPARGWTWVSPAALFKGRVCSRAVEELLTREPIQVCRGCMLSHPVDRAGLLWIGERFYPTAAAFLQEAGRLGVSRRISQVPRDFVVGETWVLFAHRKGLAENCQVCGGKGWRWGGPAFPTGGIEKCERVPCYDCLTTGSVHHPAIVGAFLPLAVEYVLRGDETEEELERLEARGLTLVRLERTDGLDVHEEGDE